MDLTSIQAIRQAAGAACLANNVGVDLLLRGRNSEARFQFAMASEKLLKIVEANDDIRRLSIQEEEITPETNTWIFSPIKPQDQGEIIILLAQVPSENLPENEDKGFLCQGMSREWLFTNTLIAIHNAVAACEIMEQLDQAMELVDIAWELIKDQDWSWEDVLLGNALLVPAGRRQTIKVLLVSIIYIKGRFFLEMFNTRLQNEQENPFNPLLMAEELNIILQEAVSSFTFVAAINQEEGSLLFLQEKPANGCRRFQEINMFLLAKAWSWLGYAFFLLDSVARKHYNALCCIAGSDRLPSSYWHGPTTAPNVPRVHGTAPSA
jgi:tetratricopeptide (TPR) repeat protein